MSKFEDRAEQYYMEGFKKMFKTDEQQKKEKEELKKAMSTKKNDEAIFESVLLDIANEAEKNKKILFNEAEGEEETSFDVEATPADEVVDPDDEPIEDTEEIPEDEMDEMDKADEILQDIDLTEIDNPTRIELIRNIIDSAQNYAGEDDMSFDDFIQTMKEVVDEFQYEEEEVPEESEEEVEEDYSGEEAVEETGEEESTEEEPEEETEEVIEESFNEKKKIVNESDEQTPEWFAEKIGKVIDKYLSTKDSKKKEKLTIDVPRFFGSLDLMDKFIVNKDKIGEILKQKYRFSGWKSVTWKTWDSDVSFFVDYILKPR